MPILYRRQCVKDDFGIISTIFEWCATYVVSPGWPLYGRPEIEKTVSRQQIINWYQISTTQYSKNVVYESDSMHLYTTLQSLILSPSQSLVLQLTGFASRMWQYEITTLLVQSVSCNKCLHTRCSNKTPLGLVCNIRYVHLSGCFNFPFWIPLKICSLSVQYNQEHLF